MEKIQPYSDEKLTYNETTGRYELTAQYVKGAWGNPFTDDNVLSVRIKRNTTKVYEYIFSRGYSANRGAVNYLISHTEAYRRFIFDCLSAQMEADLASGYNDQDKYLPENKDARDLQFLNQVSVSTENIVESSVGYGGINLIYAGTYPIWVYLFVMEK